jgi:hypothetical protein
LYHICTYLYTSSLKCCNKSKFGRYKLRKICIFTRSQNHSYKMENSPLVITLSADDIQSSEFVSYIETNHGTIATSTEIQKKKGRSGGLNQLTHLIVSDDMAINLLASAIVGVIAFSFGKLTKMFEAKPKAIIKLKNGKKIELPKSMTEAEINAEVLDCLQKGVSSIHLDS